MKNIKVTLVAFILGVLPIFAQEDTESTTSSADDLAKQLQNTRVK